MGSTVSAYKADSYPDGVLNLITKFGPNMLKKINFDVPYFAKLYRYPFYLVKNFLL